MARYKFDTIFEKHFIAVCVSSVSMSQAAMELSMNYKTLCFHAKRLGYFKAHQAGKGHSKPLKGIITPIERIFDGTHNTYQSHKLKKRLLHEGFKKHCCEQCNLSEWLNVPIPPELHHCDGNKYNNALNNLVLLCPNCHALTDTYRARNIKKI